MALFCVTPTSKRLALRGAPNEAEITHALGLPASGKPPRTITYRQPLSLQNEESATFQITHRPYSDP
ncbi:MAG: hypothetical protein ACI8PT_003145 [Gammaproteobacteria bacterium]|jgi:hypothetical protein